MSNEKQWIVGVVLGVIALIAVLVPARAHSTGVMYGLLGPAFLCYLGIFLMLKLAFDMAAGRKDHSSPDL